MTTAIERLEPTGYRRMPWKNGGGVLVSIDGDGGGDWAGGKLTWHYGRTAIVAPGPFSDLAGYERLQAVIKGHGLVLVTPSGEIDLRQPFLPQRYDGGTPIRTRLEAGTVEVVNLIADKRLFRIDMRSGVDGASFACAPGVHIVHAAAGPAAVRVGDHRCDLPGDHALRLRVGAEDRVHVVAGRVVIASVYPIR